MKAKALLISEKDFDQLVEEGQVTVIGSYTDLRTTIKGLNPYIEYVIEPFRMTNPRTTDDRQYMIESVIISMDSQMKPKIIDYPNTSK